MNRFCLWGLILAVVAGGCSKPAEQAPAQAAGEKPAPPTVATKEPSDTGTLKLPPVAKPDTPAPAKPAVETKPSAPPKAEAKPVVAAKPDAKPAATTPAAAQTPKPAGAEKPVAKETPSAKSTPPATATPQAQPSANASDKPAAKPPQATPTAPGTPANPAAPTKPTTTAKAPAGGQSPLLGTWVTVGPGSQRRLEIKENGSGAVLLGDIPWIRFTWVKDGNDIVATHVDNDVKFRIAARGEGRLSWRPADGGSAKEVEYERER
jgi:hypothetical protein